MGIRCDDHVTPLYPQKLALTSLTGGGRSVGTVRSRTKATEFFLIRSNTRFILKIDSDTHDHDIRDGFFDRNQAGTQTVMYVTEMMKN